MMINKSPLHISRLTLPSIPVAAPDSRQVHLRRDSSRFVLTPDLMRRLHARLEERLIDHVCVREVGSTHSHLTAAHERCACQAVSVTSDSLRVP
jgi:hypothetical protein